MQDIGTLINMIIQGMLDTWNTYRSITFLGTNFLNFAITLLICHALVKLMVTTNKIGIDTGGKKK